MSYNITTWKTKKMDNLVIPIDALYMTDREDWIPEKPEIFNFKTNEVDIECGCEQKILGIDRKSVV